LSFMALFPVGSYVQDHHRFDRPPPAARPEVPYLSGPAAVATAGEEIAAAHADGRPQRDSMRIDSIAQFRLY